MTERIQNIKIICQNYVIKGSGKAVEGHPWRNWKVKLVAVDNHRERKGKLNHLLDRVEYYLHPTFENPVRVFTKEPYLIQEKGWGEFDMRVVLYFTNNLAEPENIFFDLHFRDHTYTIMHSIIFNNPPPELLRLLTLEIPASSHDDHHDGHSITHKKRRTSPSSTSTTTSMAADGTIANKKIKISPVASSSPALYHNEGSGTLTPNTFNNSINIKYPASPNSNTATTSSAMSTYNEYSNESDDLYRGMHGYRLTKKATRQDGNAIVDDIYSAEDLDKVNLIHAKGKEEPIRSAWGLPEGVDMLELAKRLSNSSPEQIEEVRSIIVNHKKYDTLYEENDEEYMVDLYSLGPELLKILWDFTEKRADASCKSSMILSPFSIVQGSSNSIATDEDRQTTPP